MAETLEQLLTNDDLRNELAKNAFKYVQKFNWNKTADDFLEVVKGAVHE